MDVMTVLYITAVVVFGVVVGAQVQKRARFIYPYDAFTILILSAIVADSMLGLTGVSPMWYLSFIVGYFAGYLVVGRTAYVMVWRIDLPSQWSTLEPIVVWTEGSNAYLQPQKNRDLLRRVLFGVKHRIVSNVPLDAVWTTTSKYPLFPEFVKKTLLVEDMDTTYTVGKMFWKFSIRQYTTEMVIAYAGMVSKAELAMDQASLSHLQNQNVRLTDEVHELRKQQGPMLMEMALKLEQELDSTVPVNRMYDLIKVGKKHKEQKEKENEQEEENGSTQEDDSPVQP